MIKIKQFFMARPKVALILLAAGYLMLNSLYPLLNRPLANTYYLGTIIDDWLPFSAPWIVPYVLWYLYLAGIPLLLAFRNQHKCAQALVSLCLGLICSFIIFSIFQTHVPRPQLLGDDIFTGAVQLIYSIDEPYNAFPSIHVLATFIHMLVVAGTPQISRALKGGVWLLGIAIILSTVFIKQHVVADILGGMAVAWGCLRLALMLPLETFFPATIIQQPSVGK